MGGSLQSWIKENLNQPLGLENLNSLLSTFSRNRNSFTPEGKLDFANANFEGQDIRGFALHFCDINNCNFNGAWVDRKQFVYLSKFARQNMVDISRIKIEGADLSKVSLVGLKLDHVSFKNVQLDRYALLSILDDARAGKIDLAGVNLSNSLIRGTVLSEPLIGINGFQMFNMSGINFDGANFENADMSGAIVDRCSFKGANMKNIIMYATYARDANFSDANLQGAKLCSSDFSYSIFHNADLTGAEV